MTNSGTKTITIVILTSKPWMTILILCMIINTADEKIVKRSSIDYRILYFIINSSRYFATLQNNKWLD